MSRLYFIKKVASFSLLCLFSTFIHAQENIWEKLKTQAIQNATLEKVYLDNVFIQSYQGQEGIWLPVHSWQEWSRLLQKYGVSEKTFFRINQMSKRSRGLWNGQYVFFPYSASYKQWLAKQGIGRQSLTLEKNKFLWPVLGVKLTSRVEQRWGQPHNGLDISAAEGTPVLAAQEGRVEVAGAQGAYGLAVFIQHKDYYTTRYGHLSHIFIKKGEWVKKGQIIGLSGNTGKSTGPHLHFEVRCKGIILNPEVYLPEFSSSMYSAMEFEANLLFLERSKN